ncbi:MAG: response regulator [bacterium]
MVATARILFADDEDLFLNSTADLLERAGFECVRVRDGESAAEMLRRESFDLLITDIRMPGNFNLELVREVAKSTPPIPVIIVTGFPRLETAIDSIQLPVVAYVTKPFEFSTLLNEVRQSVMQARVARAARNVQQRIDACREDLASLSDGVDLAPRARPSAAVDAFFESAFRNIAGSLLEVRRLAEGIAAGSPREEAVCLLMNCPREARLREGILDAIAVIEKTKASFKSTELRALRHRLDLLVRGDAVA